MIEIRPEPYGSVAAARLVEALHAEINVRYEGDDEEIEPEDFSAELGPDDLVVPNGAFLVALEEEATRLGYARLHLETGLRQPEAMEMYESAGWARIANYGRYKDSPLSACYGKDLA